MPTTTTLNSNETLVYNELKRQGFTIEAISSIMGVCAGESRFTDLLENSYSSTSNNRIRAIFYKLRNYSDADLDALKSSDYNFFNAVYGGMYHNAPNEGYKYRGRGFNQITFKSNYENIRNKTNIDVVTYPEKLEDPIIASKALGAYFDSVKLIQDFEQAYRKAFVLNAGQAYTYEYYASSTNPAIQQAIIIKRQKAVDYYNYFKQMNPNIYPSSGLILPVIFPALAVVYFAYKYLIKR